MGSRVGRDPGFCGVENPDVEAELCGATCVVCGKGIDSAVAASAAAAAAAAAAIVEAVACEVCEGWATAAVGDTAPVGDAWD